MIIGEEMQINVATCNFRIESESDLVGEAEQRQSHNNKIDAKRKRKLVTRIARLKEFQRDKQAIEQYGDLSTFMGFYFFITFTQYTYRAAGAFFGFCHTTTFFLSLSLSHAMRCAYFHIKLNNIRAFSK